MGSRFIRTYEEMEIANIKFKFNDMELLFTQEIEDTELSPTIRIVLFEVVKDKDFEKNILELERLKEKGIKINTIYDDITSNGAIISFFYQDGKDRKRVFFQTHEIDGLEFIFTV